MTKETHTKGGYCAGLIMLPFVYNILFKGYSIIYSLILFFVYMYFAYLGSLAPDIDMKRSFISKLFPKIHKYFGDKFKHRGFTHSILCVCLLQYVLLFLVFFTEFNEVFLSISFGFLFGYISHLLLDILTKEGIELLYPLTINLSLLPIKTNSKSEKYIYKLLNFMMIFLIGYHFYLLM